MMKECVITLADEYWRKEYGKNFNSVKRRNPLAYNIDRIDPINKDADIWESEGLLHVDNYMYVYTYPLKYVNRYTVREVEDIPS